MTGFIKITATDHSDRTQLEVQVDVQDVFIMDRMQVLDSLCRGLEISDDELRTFAVLKGEGILDRVATVETIAEDRVKSLDADLVNRLLNTMMGGDDK